MYDFKLGVVMAIKIHFVRVSNIEYENYILIVCTLVCSIVGIIQ